MRTPNPTECNCEYHGVNCSYVTGLPGLMEAAEAVLNGTHHPSSHATYYEIQKGLVIQLRAALAACKGEQP